VADEVHRGRLFEIQGGTIAQQRGRNAKTCALGARLVKDHSESLAEATALAHKLGIDVPDQPSPSMQWEVQVVQQFSGTEFDRWYDDLEVKDHLQDIQEAMDEHEKGYNPDVREDAGKEIPVLHQH
jgi:putative membrane protein